MDRLELKHIQHYPIGGDNPIKIIQLGDEPEILTVNGVIDVDGELVICANGNDFDYNSDMKLLLRPMTDLYKPLEDGSIPIVELAKIAFENSGYGNFKADKDCCYAYSESARIIFRYNEYYGFTKHYDCVTHPSKNQLKLFEYLLEHHFNVYNLPEHLFVDINTIQD